MRATDRVTESIAAVAQLAEAWHAGWLAGDSAALLALYPDDPVLILQTRAYKSERFE